MIKVFQPPLVLLLMCRVHAQDNAADSTGGAAAEFASGRTHRRLSATLSPSSAPSALPSYAPSSMLTAAPTIAPVLFPTPAPSPPAPSTPAPSPFPSYAPTPVPTSVAIPAPTSTWYPTSNPTRTPTVLVVVAMSGITCGEFEEAVFTAALGDLLTSDATFQSVVCSASQRRLKRREEQSRRLTSTILHVTTEVTVPMRYAIDGSVFKYVQTTLDLALADGSFTASIQGHAADGQMTGAVVESISFETFTPTAAPSFEPSAQGGGDDSDDGIGSVSTTILIVGGALCCLIGVVVGGFCFGVGSCMLCPKKEQADAKEQAEFRLQARSQRLI